MGKAGFDEDALIEISRIEHDDLSVAPANPPSGQLSTYARSGKIKQKTSAGVEKTVGPQVASEIDVNTTTADNTLVGATTQAILDKYFGPTNSELPTYLANGEVNFIEYFKSATQTTGNRIAKVTFTYDASLNPTTETLQLFDTDGTTVLKTVTYTHTFVSSEFTKTTQVTS
jgi:hypothetical protein